jgi:hypothetical protein
MISQRPAFGGLKKLDISNYTSVTSMSKAMPLDGELVALCCFLIAAFAASRHPPAVWKAPGMPAYATPMHESMPAPRTARAARSKWDKPLSTKSV